jgi:hypothetical protein
MVVGTAAGLLAAMCLLIGLAVKSGQDAPESVAGGAQTSAPTAAAPVEVMPSEPAPVPPASAPPALFATDDKGFVNSNARCDGAQTAAAIGRTERSFVVICAGQNGHYEYLGVRLSDDAVLRTAAETTPAHGFLARNASVTYAVSPTELVVTEGETVIKQEPMLEFRGSEATRPAPR